MSETLYEHENELGMPLHGVSGDESTDSFIFTGTLRNVLGVAAGEHARVMMELHSMIEQKGYAQFDRNIRYDVIPDIMDCSVDLDENEYFNDLQKAPDSPGLACETYPAFEEQNQPQNDLEL